MISAQHLTKMYNNTAVVNDVTLTVNKGEIFGLLGPNAAGKTTVIRILCGIINYDAGQISINNISVEKAKGDFGYVAQYFGQYEDLSVWENIQFYAQMAYADKDQSFFSNLVKTGLWSEGYFQMYKVDNRQQIINEIRSGRAKAGLLIDQDFSENSLRMPNRTSPFSLLIGTLLIIYYEFQNQPLQLIFIIALYLLLTAAAWIYAKKTV